MYEVEKHEYALVRGCNHLHTSVTPAECAHPSRLPAEDCDGIGLSSSGERVLLKSPRINNFAGQYWEILSKIVYNTSGLNGGRI